MSDSENSLLSFDENSRPTQAVGFDFEAVSRDLDGEDVPAADRVDLAREKLSAVLDALSWALCGGGDDKVIARRVLLAAFIVREFVPGAPRTGGELARRLGISRQAAHAALTRFRRELLANRQQMRSGG